MRPFPEPVPITRPLVPDLARLSARLASVLGSRQLSNGGAQHAELEAALAGLTRVDHVALTASGTTALILALAALGRRGDEVLTTPYTFAATTNAIAWAGMTPVFCDVDADDWTLSPDALRAALTPRTRGILAVHTYGIPCRVHAIERFAREHGLFVVYDAAHAFGVERGGESALAWGDASCVSFHATKLLHTGEGGAVFTRSAATHARLDRLRNFGLFARDGEFEVGLNGKMSELSAALGLCVLDEVAREITRRGALVVRYQDHFRGVPGLRHVGPPAGVAPNHQYFVLAIDAARFGRTRDEVWEALRAANVHARRYFHPLTSAVPAWAGVPSARPENLPRAHAAAKEALCLPLFGDLGTDVVDRIAEVVLHTAALERAA